ncbi:071L [Invertebrate iridescent virus Kaz2018]|nr:071L [Invertebrate iridescent virus Kaz2018]
MSVIEIITDSSINTTTDVGIVNLTQTEPLLCGFITIDTGNVYDLISSACMFMKQFSPYNLRLFESSYIEENTMTFIRVNSENPAYFVCRVNSLGNDNNEEKIQKIKNNLEINFLYNNIIHDESNILIIG